MDMCKKDINSFKIPFISNIAWIQTYLVSMVEEIRVKNKTILKKSEE